jgi:hypothetical protein
VSVARWGCGPDATSPGHVHVDFVGVSGRCDPQDAVGLGVAAVTAVRVRLPRLRRWRLVLVVIGACLAVAFLPLSSWGADVLPVTCTASTFNGGWTPPLGCDGNSTTAWLSNGAPTNSWLRADMGAPVWASGYSVREALQNVRSPGTFKFQGSADGTTFTDLDTRTETAWATSQRRDYTLAASVEYRYYRLLITGGIAGNDGYVGTREFGITLGTVPTQTTTSTATQTTTSTVTTTATATLIDSDVTATIDASQFGALGLGIAFVLAFVAFLTFAEMRGGR